MLHTPRMPRIETRWRLQCVRAKTTTIQQDETEDGRAWIWRPVAEEKQDVLAEASDLCGVPATREGDGSNVC